MSKMSFDSDFALLHAQMESTGILKEIQAFANELIPMISASGKGGSTGTSVKSGGSGSSSSALELPSASGLGKRMRERRDRDDDDRRRGGGKRGHDDDDYDIVFAMKGISMMSYAIDVTTGDIYVGYSGGASAVFGNKVKDRLSAKVRQQRVAPYIGGVTKQTRFDPSNCAEVSALNVALAHGSQIGNLLFLSMDTDQNLRDPCANCIQWIQAYARGYIDAGRHFHIYR